MFIGVSFFINQNAEMTLYIYPSYPLNFTHQDIICYKVSPLSTPCHVSLSKQIFSICLAYTPEPCSLFPLLKKKWGNSCFSVPIKCVLFYRSRWTAQFWCLQYYLGLEIVNFLDLNFPLTFGKERLIPLDVSVCYTDHEVVCFGSYWRAYREEMPSSL